MTASASIALATILTLPHTRAALALDQAGVAAAVHGEVARSSTEHPIGQQILGEAPIYLADKIESGDRSGLQITLLDNTTFSIGPNSSVTIDSTSFGPVDVQTHVTFHDSDTTIAKFAVQHLTLPQGTDTASGGSVAVRP